MWGGPFSTTKLAAFRRVGGPKPIKIPGKNRSCLASGGRPTSIRSTWRPSKTWTVIFRKKDKGGWKVSGAMGLTEIQGRHNRGKQQGSAPWKIYREVCPLENNRLASWASTNIVLVDAISYFLTSWYCWHSITVLHEYHCITLLFVQCTVVSHNRIKLQNIFYTQITTSCSKMSNSVKSRNISGHLRTERCVIKPKLIGLSTLKKQTKKISQNFLCSILVVNSNLAILCTHSVICLCKYL